jgi:hypothetical protein
MPDNIRIDSPALPSLREVNAQLSLLGRIPEAHPVRLLALSVARGEPLPTIQPLIDALLDPSPDRWRVRAVAAWALSRTALTPDQADGATASLMDVLEQARPERLRDRFARSLKRHLAVTFGGGALATLLIFALFVEHRYGYGGPSFFEAFWMLTAMIGVTAFPFETAASFLYDSSLDSRARAGAAVALGRLGQAECVGALSGALFDRSKRVRDAAAAALHQVLPLLEPRHFGLFGAQSIANLGRALNHADAQLVSKALGALAVVGTSHAIPFVRRAAQSGRTVRLRDAAADVLRVLEERQRTESVHATLLRATASPENPAAVLVRPSSGSASDLDELLLRAAPETDR